MDSALHYTMDIENPFNQIKEQHKDPDPKPENSKPSHRVSLMNLLSPEWQEYDGNFLIMNDCDHNEEALAQNHGAFLAQVVTETPSHQERADVGQKLEKKVWSKREHQLLTFLSKNPNKVVSKKDLVEAIWGECKPNSSGELARIPNLVARCREKRATVPLEELSEFGSFEIQSVSGKGYKLIYTESAKTTFGELIKSSRLTKCLTQVQLAFLSGTTQKAICNIEQDARKPNPKLFFALTSALNLDTEKLRQIIESDRFKRIEETS